MKRIGFDDFDPGRRVRDLALSGSIERSPFN
jgi:hypothetical protein